VWLGKFAFGGGRHAAELSSRESLTRPPSGPWGPVFWLVASDSPLYLSEYRPDVSLSQALPWALASSSILLSRGIRLAPTLRGDPPLREPWEVTPFPVSIARILRAVLSTGFIGSAGRSVARSAGALSVAFWLQRLSLLRWLLITMALIYLCFRCP
jgi:hypothetical protein